MDEIGNVENTLSFERDMSLNSYNSCKQQYTRLQTKIEEEIRRAYNQLEAAESMYRSAAAEYDAAMSRASSAEDDSDRSAAQSQADYARQRMADAEVEIARANEALARANGAMGNLTNVWAQYSPSAEAAANRIEDNYVAFSHLTSNGNNDLGQYIGLMEQAKGALYVDESGSMPFSEFTSGACGGLNGAQCMGRSGIITSQNGQQIHLSIRGEYFEFPNTKTGMARAYRIAKQRGDTEIAAKISKAFENGACEEA